MKDYTHMRMMTSTWGRTSDDPRRGGARTPPVRSTNAMKGLPGVFPDGEAAVVVAEGEESLGPRDQHHVSGGVTAGDPGRYRFPGETVVGNPDDQVAGGGVQHRPPAAGPRDGRGGNRHRARRPFPPVGREPGVSVVDGVGHQPGTERSDQKTLEDRVPSQATICDDEW